MRSKKHIFAIDFHTKGESTRVVLSDIGPIPGPVMAEKRQYLIDHLDHIRKALMHGPRRHRGMFGSVILEPTDPQADLGIVFMDGGKYLNICGHGTIGTVTVTLEMGLLEPSTHRQD